MRIKTKIVLFTAIICILIISVICHCYKNRKEEQIVNTPPIEEGLEDPLLVCETIKEIEMESVNVENELSTEIIPIFFLNDYERLVVECIVMGESGGESYEGQVLVAQCVLNACLKDNLQPSEVRNVYKYSGWNANPSESVKNAVSAVFDNGYKVTDEFILYFYAPKYCNSVWHETQKFVIEVGGHRFFAEWE